MVVQTEQRLAVLIDADNASKASLKVIMDEIAKYGLPTIKHAYGDWAKLSGWKEVLLEIGAVPVQQYAYTIGKNATDAALIIEAMDILHENNVEGFVIVSSDSDFTPLALRLRESGKKVYGIGEKKTPRPFITACDKFIYVEILLPGQNEEKLKNDEPASIQVQEIQKRQVSEQTIRFLAQCILESSGDSGQCLLSAVGNMISKKKPDFDSRNYGYSQLSKLFRAIPRFEVGGEGGYVWVKDKEAK
ncbi:MAG: NYN domain-containing protein [Kiritimatiellae bacterium]|nr:NYN domain-containing protein [Kiritimatiellia bacterium]